MNSIIENMLSLAIGRNNNTVSRNRERYYANHPGLRPEHAGRPLSDNAGLRIREGKGDFFIKDIDMNIFKNAKKHFCDRYDIINKKDPDGKPQEPRLVIRRGFSFELTLRLSRSYRKGKDKIIVQLSLGKRPKIPKHTLIRLPIDSSGAPKEWKASVKMVNANEVTVEISSPPTCFVGVWRLSGQVVYSDSTRKPSDHKEVFILFNPFNKDDEVYMNDPAEREEYVMNESGLVFTGSCDAYTIRPWGFDQFYGHVLECCMYLLDKSDIADTERGKPVQVSRRLAAMVNSSDDGGLLQGNWSGDYTGGTPPMDWSGSSRILEEFWKTKKTVKFGQCWVFSGVLVTVCRAFGIPCRSVTNYCSAHDTDSSVSVDQFFSEKLDYEEFMTEDSVWNFHVWNECYMMRPDLSNDKYDGWQVLDATPQETSDGIYSCGPCPVMAVKNGDVHAQYDAPFIIAEVNADIVRWSKQKDGRYKVFEVNKNEVGRVLLTKRLRVFEGENITYNYKYPEGSSEERVSIQKAMMVGSRGYEIQKSSAEDVTANLVVDKDTLFGADFTTKIVLESKSKQVRTISGSLSISAIFYTGVISHVLSSRYIVQTLQPGAKETLDNVIRYNDYAGKIQDESSMGIRCNLEVEETKQFLIMNKVFRLKKTELKIQAADKAKLNVRFPIMVRFRNPLPTTLTKCVLYTDGAGLTKHQTLNTKNVRGGEELILAVFVTPWSKGVHTLVCNFSSKQLQGITGSKTITVEKA